jgi:hypothetical protein
VQVVSAASRPWFRSSYQITARTRFSRLTCEAMASQQLVRTQAGSPPHAAPADHAGTDCDLLRAVSVAPMEVPGAIRFNPAANRFEGFDGTHWFLSWSPTSSFPQSPRLHECRDVLFWVPASVSSLAMDIWGRVVGVADFHRLARGVVRRHRRCRRVGWGRRRRICARVTRRGRG